MDTPLIALGWMDKRFDRQTTTCIVGADNHASIRVAVKNGYREFARADFRGAPVIQFRRAGSVKPLEIG